ncbi:MAG: Ig-like domain-containing protein, partial [Candidatus Zixiibacteriota bacterium]
MSNTLNKNRLQFYIGLTLAAAIIISGAGVAVDLLASAPQTGPDLNVKVVDFYPQGDVDRQMNITIKFSRDMVPGDSLDKAVLDPPIEFDPPLPGLARWVEKNTLRFYPDSRLRPATAYKIQVKSKAKFLYGNQINDKTLFQFRTAPLKVNLGGQPSGINRLFEDKTGYTRLFIRLEFNYPVNVEQVIKAMTITGEKNAENPKPAFELSHF